MTLDSPVVTLGYSSAIGFPTKENSTQVAHNRARQFSLGKIAARIHRSIFQLRRQATQVRSRAEREALDPLHELHLLENENKRFEGFATLMCSRSDSSTASRDSSAIPPSSDFALDSGSIAHIAAV